MKMAPHNLSPRRLARRGVALMMALLTLFLLLSVAVPYSFMTSHQEAAMIGYRDRRVVRDGAWTAVALGTSHLRRHNRVRAFANWVEISEGAKLSTPWTPLYDHRVDGLDERSVNVAAILRDEYRGAEIGVNARDPQGSVWSARIEDEQGKININTAPPNLLGNIFGSAIVEKAENVGSAYDITVADGAEHFLDSAGAGKGYFVISGVLISYERRVGNIFRGCVIVSKDLNALSAKALGRTRDDKDVPIFNAHRWWKDNPSDLKWVTKGTLIIPVVAHLVAYWRLLGNGELAPFSQVDQIRQVAELPIIPSESGALEVAPECFLPREWVRARSALTVNSRGPLNNGFGNVHLAGWVTEADPEGPTDVQRVGLARNNPLNPNWVQANDPRLIGGGVSSGRTIRLRFPTASDTGTHMGGSVYAMTIGGGFGLRIVSPYQLPEERDNALLEVQEITPININTASREVLIANLKGIRSGDNFISAADAALLADAILYVRYRDVIQPDPRFEKLDKLIATATETNRLRPLRVGVMREMSELKLLASVLTKSQSGSDQGLDDNLPNLLSLVFDSPERRWGIKMAPFIFHSYGAYTVRGHATLHAPSGIEIARAGISEVIEAGTDYGEIYSDKANDLRKLRWEWRDREYLEANSSLPLGSIMHVGRRAIKIGSNAPRQLGTVELPLLLDSQMRPQPAGAFEGRTTGFNVWSLGRDRNIGGNRFAPAFIRSAGYELALDAGGHYGDTVEAGEGTLVGDLLGGSIEFWYQIPRRGFASEEEYLFDVGLEENVNRLSLLWWAPGSAAAMTSSVTGSYLPAHGLIDDLPALTLRITDRTLQEAYSIISLKPAAGRWLPGEWVFLRAAWKGLDIGHLSLLADSMARVGGPAQPSALQDQVVLSNQQSPPAWVSQSSYLTADLIPTSTTLSIEPDKALGFPDFGVVRIGREAIEYSARSADGTLSGITRGARGTFSLGNSIPSGTRVAMWGYETDIFRESDAPFLPQGGGVTGSEMPGHGRYRVAVQTVDNDATYLYPERIGPKASMAPDATEITLTPIDGDAGALPEYAVLYLRGPAWRRYTQDPDTMLLVPDYSLPSEDPRPARVTVPRGKPPEIAINNFVSSFVLIQRRADNRFSIVSRLQRNPQGELVLSQDPGWYFMAGPASTSNVAAEVIAHQRQGGNPRPPDIEWEHSGTIAIVCSLHANNVGRYLDPASTPALVPARSARVQVATSYLDTATNRPYFDWITYHDLFEGGNFRLFAFTDDRNVPQGAANVSLTSEAVRIAIALQTAENVGPMPMGMREFINGKPHRLPAGASINPVFSVRGVNSLSPVPAGIGDDVTLLWETQSPTNQNWNRNSHKTRSMIARTQRQGNRQYVGLWSDRGGVSLATMPHGYYNNVNQLQAFGDTAANVAALSGRMLKFPEPNLPRGMPLQMRMGGAAYPAHSADGQPPAGRVDELRTDASNVANFVLLTPLDPNDDKLTINLNPVGGATVGLIKIDDEYISFSGINVLNNGMAFELLKLVRGVLGTQASFHALNASIFNLANVPVFRASQTIGANQANLALSGPYAATPYGFLRAENGSNAPYEDMEIIGYNQGGRGNFVSGRFRPNGNGGLFRGAYGTNRSSWTDQSVFVQMPVRYPDFMPKDMRDVGASVFAGTEVAHFEGREALPNSHFGLLRWSMDADGENYPADNGAAPYRAKLVFRFNPEVDWSETPVVLEGAGKSSGVKGKRINNRRAMERLDVDAKTGLFALEFDWRDSLNRDDAGIGRRDYFVDLAAIAPQAMQAFEWRYYVSYNDGVYARGDYKRAPRFRGLSVELESETRVLSHEETR